jgi:hypothetical protein
MLHSDKNHLKTTASSHNAGFPETGSRSTHGKKRRKNFWTRTPCLSSNHLSVHLSVHPSTHLPISPQPHNSPSLATGFLPMQQEQGRRLRIQWGWDTGRALVGGGSMGWGTTAPGLHGCLCNTLLLTFYSWANFGCFIGQGQDWVLVT